jgi:four helix bundle protein
MKIERFEDFVAWQRARELTQAVYMTTGNGEFAKDFDLVRQIRRAAVSVMSNIAEGFERHGPKEFHQFLSIAKGSCAEVRSLCYVALDVGYIEENVFHTLMSQARDVARLVGGLRASVAGRRDGVATGDHRP